VQSPLKPRILHQAALLVVAVGLSNDSYGYNEMDKESFFSVKGCNDTKSPRSDTSKKVGRNIWYFTLWNTLMSQMLLYFVIVIVFIVSLSSMNIFGIICFALSEICCATFVGVYNIYFSYSSLTFLYVFIFIFMCWSPWPNFCPFFIGNSAFIES
jgi:hypothetical protein